MSFWTDPVGSVVDETMSVVDDTVGFVGDVFGDLSGSSSIPMVTYTPYSSENLQNQMILEGGLQKQQSAASANAAIRSGASPYQVDQSLGDMLSDTDTKTEGSAYELGLKTTLTNQEAQTKADIANSGASYAQDNLNRLFLGGALSGISSLTGSYILSGSNTNATPTTANSTFFADTVPTRLTL